MAVPASVSVMDLSGKYTVNKKIGQDPDAILSLQGVGWMKRKAMSAATVTLHVKQTGELISIKNMFGDKEMGAEERHFDNTPREVESPFGGKVTTQTEICDAASLTEPAIKAGWTDPKVIHIVSSHKSDGWTMEQAWGIQTINGEKRHVRLLICKKGGKTAEAKLVYDFVA